MIQLDFQQLMDDVPSTLKEEIIYFQYGGIIKKIDFLKNASDNKFIWDLIQVLKKSRYHKGMDIYYDN